MVVHGGDGSAGGGGGSGGCAGIYVRLIIIYLIFSICVSSMKP